MSDRKCKREPTPLELADGLEGHAIKTARNIALGVLGYSHRDHQCQEAWAGLQIAQWLRETVKVNGGRADLASVGGDHEDGRHAKHESAVAKPPAHPQPGPSK